MSKIFGYSYGKAAACLACLSLGIIAASAIGCENREHRTLGPEDLAWVPYDVGEIVYFTNGANTMRFVAGPARVYLDNEKKNTENTYETCEFSAPGLLLNHDSSTWSSPRNFGWEVHMDAELDVTDQVFFRFQEYSYDIRSEGDTVEIIGQTIAEFLPGRLTDSIRSETLTIDGVTYQDVKRILIPQTPDGFENPLLEAWFSDEYGFVRFAFEDGEWDLAR